MNEKKDILTKTWVVAVLASICCMLWGSAFSCVKIGYSLMNILYELEDGNHNTAP